MGGRHLDGFLTTLRDLLIESGVPADTIFFRRSLTQLPGYFRATKMWDLLVVRGQELQAVVELKAQVGPSFSNNVNNRAEEALGSAIDLWTAYREGTFRAYPAPWVGYLFLLEDCDATRQNRAPRSPHFPVLDEFSHASYAERYELLLRRLVTERHYSATCLLLSDPRRAGADQNYTEPAADLGVSGFVGGLVRRCSPRTGF